MLERLRTVTFAAITANVEGTVRFMSLFEPLRPGAEQAKNVFTTALHYWPVLMMVYAMVTIIIVSLIGWWALSRVLDRLRGIPDVHSWSRRSTAHRPHRFRSGSPTPGSAIPAPTTMRCGR